MRTVRQPVHRATIAFAAAVFAAFAALLPVVSTPTNAAAPVRGDEDADPPAAQQPAAARRVIVRVSRTREVAGYVEREEGDVVTIRLLDGSLETFNTPRIIGIIDLVDPRPGQAGVVILRNGQTREGVVLEDAFEYVLIEIEGIRARLPRDTVDRVLLEPSFTDQYEAFKQSIQPGMTDRQLQLCRWLIQEREYELARLELEELLREHPSEEARKLLSLVNAQITLDQQRAAQPASSDEPEQPQQPASVDDEPLPADQVITADDVNLMRVYEIDFSEPPKVNIEPDTIQRLIERYGTSPLLPANRTDRNALFRAEPIDLVRLMFEVKARDLYGEIQVQTEPHSLNLFRTKVHNAWLIENCATSRCHGGPDSGRFFLVRKRHLDDRVRYTNLLILERLRLDSEWPLIDYDEPANSLIVQYALPRTEARKPHPEVRGWRPVFSPTNKRLLDGTIQWINSMMKPRPEYPVDYEPPARILPQPAATDGEQPADGSTPDTGGRVPR
jgi:hypothetical protein